MENEKNKQSLFNTFRAKKPFEIKDIFLYVFVIIFAIISILCFFLLKNPDPVSGYVVEIDNNKIITVDTTNRSFTKNGNANITVNDKNGNFYIFTVYHSDDKKEFSEITIDIKNGYAYVSDSTCSNHTCEHSGRLYDTGVIVCIPYGLKILPVVDTDELIIGGGS